MKILYLGLDLERFPLKDQCIHYPIMGIRYFPREDARVQRVLDAYPQSSHILLTSRSAAQALFSLIPEATKKNCQWIVVGKGTAAALGEISLERIHVAEDERAEGMLPLMEALLQPTHQVLWPHSALSRPVLRKFLQEAQIPFVAEPVYEPTPPLDLPALDFEEIESIYFTSPSTVKFFLELHGSIPPQLQIHAIGPVTGGYLQSLGYSCAIALPS